MDDIITTLGTVSKGYISAEVLKILYTLDPLTQRALAGAVGSGAVMVINQHVNFATAFKTAFFDVAPREKQQALPLRPDYQETMPQAEEYGGFASYIFFGEDPLAFCVSERTLDAAVVSSKVAEPQKISFRDARGSTVTYSPSQIVIVESDLCLKLGDALAFSATGAAVPEGYVLAANAMFNRIKDNWFQNLFIRAKLLQVLDKLLDNAVRFTEAGSIVLSVSRDGKNFLFSVTDTGCGIAFELQDKIFEKFAQSDDTASRTHGGVGLGLTITALLIELMDGEISVQSAPLAGSKFSIRLPMMPVPSADATRTIESQHG